MWNSLSFSSISFSCCCRPNQPGFFIYCLCCTRGFEVLNEATPERGRNLKCEVKLKFLHHKERIFIDVIWWWTSSELKRNCCWNLGRIKVKVVWGWGWTAKFAMIKNKKLNINLCLYYHLKIVFWLQPTCQRHFMLLSICCVSRFTWSMLRNKDL